MWWSVGVATVILTVTGGWSVGVATLILTVTGVVVSWCSHTDSDCDWCGGQLV